jgi:type IV pilus assembly protein PilA
MLSKLRKTNRDQGFTIIEVLIVLAIAGLILLIVFLAVPALQRNSRNTQRKDDVSRIGSAVQEFINNNNGTLPTTSDDASVQALLGTLAFYTNANVNVKGAPGGSGSIAADTDHVGIYTGAKCAAYSGAGGGQAAFAGTTRQIAIVYQTETGSGTANLCTSE